MLEATKLTSDPTTNLEGIHLLLRITAEHRGVVECISDSFYVFALATLLLLSEIRTCWCHQSNSCAVYISREIDAHLFFLDTDCSRVATPGRKRRTSMIADTEPSAIAIGEIVGSYGRHVHHLLTFTPDASEAVGAKLMATQQSVMVPATWGPSTMTQLRTGKMGMQYY